MPPATRRSDNASPGAARDVREQPFRKRPRKKPPAAAPGVQICAAADLQRPSVRAWATAATVTVSIRIRVSGADIATAMHALATAQAAAARSAHRKEFKFESTSRGIQSGLDLDVLITASGNARKQLGSLASLDPAVHGTQQASKALPIPSHPEEAAWLLLDVVGMQLHWETYSEAGFDAQTSLQHAQVSSRTTLHGGDFAKRWWK